MTRRTNLTHATHDPARGAWRSICERCQFPILARTQEALVACQVDHERYRNARELADAVIDAIEGKPDVQ